MNVTGMHELILTMAERDFRSRETVDAKEQYALRMRLTLDANRRHRAFQKLQSDSFIEMRDGLLKLESCDVCGWEHEVVDGVGIVNPMVRCKGDFGCALECLRYKSCEWHPGILPSGKS